MKSIKDQIAETGNRYVECRLAFRAFAQNVLEVLRGVPSVSAQFDEDQGGLTFSYIGGQFKLSFGFIQNGPTGYCGVAELSSTRSEFSLDGVRCPARFRFNAEGQQIDAQGKLTGKVIPEDTEELFFQLLGVPFRK